MDMDKKDMLERVAKAARRAYMKGFAAGSGGNVSIRIQGQVYICLLYTSDAADEL